MSRSLAMRAPSTPTAQPRAAGAGSPASTPALPRAAGAGSSPSDVPAQPAAAWQPPERDVRFVYTRRAPRVPPGFDPLPRPAPSSPSSPGAAPPAPTSTAPLPKDAQQVPPVVNQHRMTTRAKAGYRMPALFQATSLTPVPKTFRGGLADPNWRAAMEEEYPALLQNSTWDLVPRPPGANVVSGKWIFKHKFLADGSLERYKARWVLRGFA